MIKNLAITVFLALGGLASAATYWVEGVTPQHGWYDADKDSRDVGNMCWAATAANMLAWWQDHNPQFKQMGPQGHEAIWNTYRQAFPNCAGEPFYVLQWWFNGVLATDKIKLTDFGKGQGGYYKALAESCGRAFPGTDLKWENVADNSSARLRELMSQGYAVAIGIRRLDDFNKITPVWHMLSLWGVEYDEETRQVTAVYLTDSNDSAGEWPTVQKGLFRAAAAMREVTDEKGGKTRGLVLRTPEGWFKDNALITTLVELQADAAVKREPAPMPHSQLAEEHPACAWDTYPRWSALTPQRIAEDMRFMLREAQGTLDAICAVEPGRETFDNVFLAYQDMQYRLNQTEASLSVLSANMDSPEVRAASDEMRPQYTAFEAAITSNEQLWAVIKRAAAQPWVKDLSPARQRFVQDVVDAFRDNGADLPPAQKARKAELVQRISKLQLQFAKMLLDSKNAWQLVVTDKAQLAGMSDEWMQRAAAAALKKGFGTPENPQWLVTLDSGSANEVTANCTVSATRKLVWEGGTSQGCGEHDTAPVVQEILQLRLELARLLGFKNYADDMTAHRMVGSGDNALAFVDDMIAKVKPAFDREVDELRDWVQRETGTRPDKFNPWDLSFYSKQLQKRKYDFDVDSLRPYFEAEQVRIGMFAIASRLYGVTFREIPTVCLKPGEKAPDGAAEVWHPQVRLFAVHAAATGAHLGSFYMDIFPRASKRTGAWMSTIAFGAPATADAPHRPHLAALCANVTPPAEGKPALLPHRDVRTLFHEFGHMMHAMLSDCELQMQSGTLVDHDFVELPSQLNENWVWEPEALATYARHYKTGRPLPKDLLQKRLATRFFFPASSVMAQLCLAKLDLEMHINFERKFQDRDIDAATEALLAGMRYPATASEPSMARKFGHVMNGGYAAGYYSYKWAEVLAADAFTRFSKEGVLNPATGADYRRCILSKGDSKPAMQLFDDFMHRKPNPDALLQKQGIIK